MATKPSYPPGVEAGSDEPGLGQDLSTLFSNPALLLSAAGVLAPQEAAIGNSWWRVGPRLQGLGAVLGAAREANQEQRFGGQLQKLGQQGLLPPATPAGAEANTAAPADPWSGMLPPGQDRQSFLSKLTPDMIRQIGSKPEYGKLVDQYATAGETNQKQAALANAWYAQLQHTHPEPVARQLALAQAAANKQPSEQLTSTPGEHLDTALMQAKADKKIELALAGGLDVNNSQDVTAYLKQNPDVNAARLFSRTGNVVAANAFYADFVNTVNEKQLHPRGMHMKTEMDLDPKTGEMRIKLTEGPIPMTPQDIRASAQALQPVILDLAQHGALPAPMVAYLQLQLKQLMINPNPKQYEDLQTGLAGMTMRHLAIQENQPFLVQAKVEQSNGQLDGKIKEIDAQLAKPPYSVLTDAREGTQWAKDHPGDVTRMRVLTQQKAILQQGRVRNTGVMSIPDLQRSEGETYRQVAALEGEAADTGMRHRVTGKTWMQVLPELRKQIDPKTGKPLTPAQIEQQKQVFLSESQ